MLIGRVTPQRDAVVRVEVLGPTGLSLSLEAAIDTGYNGFLTLSEQRIQELDLAFVGTAGAALGDGNHVRMDLYVAAIRWEVTFGISTIGRLRSDCPWGSTSRGANRA